MQYENGSMEKIADRRGGGDAMHEFLCAFKSELAHVFGKDENLDLLACWGRIRNTIGWENALSRASRTTFPEIAEFKHKLNWRDSNEFDRWIIHCAWWRGLINTATNDEPENKEDNI